MPEGKRDETVVRAAQGVIMRADIAALVAREVDAEAVWRHIAEALHDADLLKTDDDRKILSLARDPQHYIEFREDGWTIAHPLIERLEGTLFACPLNWHSGDPGVRGRFVLGGDGSLREATND